MNLAARWVLTLLLGAALGFAGAGCGGSPKTVVKGQVHFKGQPLPADKGEITVIFHQEIKGKENYAKPRAAVVNQQNGTFEVPGANGKGIPHGTYRICVWQRDPNTQADRFNDNFGEDTTTIVREVTGDDKEIVIDLSRPNG